LGRIKERPRSVLSASEAHQGIVETGNEHARILLEVEWNDKMRIYFTASARQENIEMKLTVPLNKCACTQQLPPRIQRFWKDASIQDVPLLMPA